MRDSGATEGMWPPIVEASPEKLTLLAKRAYRQRRQEWVPHYEQTKQGIDSGRMGPAFGERSVLVYLRRTP